MMGSAADRVAMRDRAGGVGREENGDSADGTMTGSCGNGERGADAGAATGETATGSYWAGGDTTSDAGVGMAVVAAAAGGELAVPEGVRGESSPVGESTWVGTAAQGTESMMARSALGGRTTALVVSTVLPMSVVEPSGLRKNALSGNTWARAEVLGAACWGGTAACCWCRMDCRLGVCRFGSRCSGACRPESCRPGTCRPDSPAERERVSTTIVPAMRSC